MYETQPNYSPYISEQIRMLWIMVMQLNLDLLLIKFNLHLFFLICRHIGRGVSNLTYQTTLRIPEQARISRITVIH